MGPPNNNTTILAISFFSCESKEPENLEELERSLLQDRMDFVFPRGPLLVKISDQWLTLWIIGL